MLQLQSIVVVVVDHIETAFVIPLSLCDTHDAIEIQGCDLLLIRGHHPRHQGFVVVVVVVVVRRRPSSSIVVRRPSSLN